MKKLVNINNLWWVQNFPKKWLKWVQSNENWWQIADNLPPITNRFHDICSHNRKKQVLNFQNFSEKWSKWLQCIENWCQIVENFPPIITPKTASQRLFRLSWKASPKFSKNILKTGLIDWKVVSNCRESPG